MLKGIIVIKNLALTQEVQHYFPNWLVVASKSAQEEVEFVPTPDVGE